LAQPKNTETQAQMATQNPSWGTCDKGNCRKKRLLHWNDINKGNLDCEAEGCKGHYVVS